MNYTGGNEFSPRMTKQRLSPMMTVYPVQHEGEFNQDIIDELERVSSPFAPSAIGVIPSHFSITELVDNNTVSSSFSPDEDDYHTEEYPTSVKHGIPSATTSAAISAQPASYQIANYNVYPTLSFAFQIDPPVPQLARISLVETESGYEFKRGFQSNVTWTLNPKEEKNTIQFSGLKLNKMGILKEEMRVKHLKEYNFKIRVRVDGKMWESASFKIVSNCAQLPKEVRDFVRPSKKPNNRDDKEEDEEED